jgi:hypothetical protein
MRTLDFSTDFNASSRAVALGSPRPITRTSTRKLSVEKWGRMARKADNLTAICRQSVYKMWEPRRLLTLRVSTASYKEIINRYCNMHKSIWDSLSNFTINDKTNVCVSPTCRED